MTTIESLCLTVTSGGTPRRGNPDYWNNGTIPWVKTGELKDCRIYDADEKITEVGLAESSAKIFPENTILMAMYGDGRTITGLGIVKNEVATNQACCAMIVDPKKCDHQYLYYSLMHHRHKLLGLVVAGAQRNLSVGTIKQFETNSWPLKTQKNIASTLSVYDDLIENNTRRIQILEEMAQKIYTEWFVHFRFPGHEKIKMVDSELGQIPNGWEFKRLGDLCSEKTITVQPDAVDPDTPYVGLEHIPRKSITLQNWDNAEKITSTKKTFKLGDILFGKIRPYFHKVSIAPINGITSTDSIVIRAEESDFFPLVLCCTSSVPFVDHATQTSNGTKMPRANWKVLVKYQIPFPNKEILNQFNNFINSIISQTRTLMFKNRNLRKTRDLLLPKLISGEIDVSDMSIPEELAA